MNRAEKEIQDEIQSARNFLALYGVISYTESELRDSIFNFIQDNRNSLNNFLAAMDAKTKEGEAKILNEQNKI
jgi:hypothetical protein